MADQIKYSKVNNNEVLVSGYLNGISPNLTIPEQIKHSGKVFQVTEIGESAFSGCSTLQSVFLEQIKNVRTKAFAGCENLKLVQFTEHLTSLGEHSFAWCGLERIIFPTQLTHIGQYAFVGCNRLRQIICTPATPPKISDKSFDQDTLEKGAIYVQLEAIDLYKNDENWSKFKNIHSISELKKLPNLDDEDEEDEEEQDKDLIFTENVIFRISENDENQVCVEQCNPDLTGTLHLPETVGHEGKIYLVTEIEKGALENCEKLQQIHIPANISYIPFGTFAHCDALQHIRVDAGSQSFCDKDGVLFDKYGNILLCYPKGRKEKSYQVPPTTVGLAPACFIDCTTLESVYLFDNIRLIGIQAFYNCTSLRTISLPISLNELSGGAFYKCDKLESVYVQGSAPAETNDPFDDDTLKRATLYVSRDNLQKYKAADLWNKFGKIKMLNDISIDNGSMTFRPNGSQTATLINVDKKLSGALSIPSTITYKGNTYTVDRIGRNSIEDCLQLTSIHLPETIASIGYRSVCVCSKIKSLVLPPNLRFIENEAFCFNVNLTTIFLPEKLEAIGDNVFNGDLKLQEIKVDANNQHYTCQDGVLYDRRGALIAYPAAKKDECYLLPDSVDAMNNTTFADAGNLTRFEVSANNQYYSTIDGVLVTKDHSILIAYPRGRKARAYTIDRSIKQISQRAFSKCKISHLDLSAGLQTFEDGAFFDCQDLVQVDLPEGLTEISERCFLWCEKLKKIEFPESIEKIGSAAFMNCRSLEHLKLPKRLTRIEKATFSDCVSLSHIELPEELESIGDHAFANCPQLTGISIPASVNSIGEGAFTNSFTELGMLTCMLNNGGNISIVMNGETPPAIAENTFDQYCYNRVNLIVPENAINNYRNTDGWAQFKNIMTANGQKGAKKGTDVFEDKDFTYKIIGTNQVELTKYKHNRTETVTVAPQTSYKGTTYTITRIGESAFEETDISGIMIEAPVEVIEKYAFANCNFLQHIKLPKTLREIGIGAFGGCATLKQVNLPQNLKELGIEAFAECRSLANIGIPDSLDKINYHTFYNCQALTAISLPSTIETLEEGAFGKCLNLESVFLSNGLKEIGEKVFEYCESLTDLMLPDSVEMINDGAFRYCSNLTQVDLPAQLNYMGNAVFKKCRNLSKLYLSSECERYAVVDNVLYTKDQSELLYHPSAYVRNNGYVTSDSVKGISDYAFEGCHITEITISGKTTAIGDYCFLNSKIESIQLPAKLKSLGANAFSGCKALKAVTLPEKVTHLREGLFRNCSKLEQIQLPEKMKAIDSLAFKGCSALKSIVIKGDNCSIAEKAFEDCKALERVKLYGIKEAGSPAFYNCNNIKDLFISTDSEIDVKKAFK
ncbi:MAG: leucine-rich repeat domain-containing protein [Paludibacteraceae bacterium]|nr:leucine-rich repeat domain-containing protein [Paludibacteraceae bacterium]